MSLILGARMTLTGAALLLGTAGAPVLAAGQETPRPRTGPQAAPPPLPPYARPEAPPRREAPPSLPGPVDSGAAPVSDVRITTQGEALGAVPQANWQPPQDAAYRLEHRPGQALDAQWARRQFELNGLVGSSAGMDRALGLMQLINRAYLNAGFFNSGLVVSPDDVPTDQQLDLKLIAGRLVGPVAVQWEPADPRGLAD